MRTYDDFTTLAGTSELVSQAGGRNRYVLWRHDGADVVGSLMGSEIIRATPDGVTVTTAGHNLPSTTDALDHGLFDDYGRGFYCHGGELYYGAERVTDGMTLDYDGNVVSHGSELAPVRGADAERHGDLIDVETRGQNGRGVAETAARRLLQDGESLARVDVEEVSTFPRIRRYLFRAVR